MSSRRHERFCSSPWKELGLTGYMRGLCATDLIEELRDRPSTLIAPTQDALKRLPVPFEHLLFDPALVEARFDFFEYSVVRGVYFAHLARRPVLTLQGAPLEIGENRVVGRYGGANVVRSFVDDALLVHVVDGLVLPSAPNWSTPARASVERTESVPLREK